MVRNHPRALLLCLSLAALGCNDLELDDEATSPGATAPGAPASAPPPAAPTLEEPGQRDGGRPASLATPQEIVVDATDRAATAWAYVDLDTGAQGKDEAAVAGWDIAIQRPNIRLKDGARASAITGRAFDAVTEAPSDGWGTDTPGDKPTYLLASGATGWYEYDGSTHVLTPRPIVYVVQTDAGYAKLQVLGWTNDAGTTAVYRLKIAGVAPPAGPTYERDAAVDATTGASKADAGT